MAKFRKIETVIWSDSWFAELEKDHKLFYLYILTNEHTKQCGIYEITKRKIAFDFGCTIDTVSKHLEYFKKQDKILYSEETNELAIKNWAKFNYSKSPKVIKCIESELLDVKNRVLIQYINGIHTLSQEEEEKEEEKDSKINWMERYQKFISEFNSIKKTSFRGSKNDLNNFKHWLEAYKPSEIIQAVKNHDTTFWAKDISPQWLFRTKDTKGQPVDYIGQLLQHKPKSKIL